jgi:hypothetical protein
MKGIPHIILSGSIQKTSLVNFLDELFNPDHFEEDGEYQTIHCVILQADVPSAET